MGYGIDIVDFDLREGQDLSSPFASGDGCVVEVCRIVVRMDINCRRPDVYKGGVHREKILKGEMNAGFFGLFQVCVVHCAWNWLRPAGRKARKILGRCIRASERRCEQEAKEDEEGYGDGFQNRWRRHDGAS